MKLKNFKLAFVISILIHAVLLALLIYKPVFKNKTLPSSIKAVVVDPKIIEQQLALMKNKQNKKPEQAGKVVDEKSKQEEMAKLAEEKAKQEAAAKAAAEKAKQEAAEKAKQEAAAKAVAEKAKQEAAAKAAAAKAAAEKAKQEAAAKSAAEKAKKDAAAKAAAEKAKKDAAAKAAEKAKQEAAAKAKELDSVFQGLASEKNQLSAAKKNEKQSTIAYYRDKYIALIEAKFITRPSYNGKTCTLNFRMSASGRVISAIPQSGPQDLCQDAQVAIRKVGVFPMPKDAELSKEFQNGWTLNFSPSTN